MYIYHIISMNVCRYKSLNHIIPNRHRYNVSTISKTASIEKRYYQQKRRNTIERIKSFNNDAVAMSYFIGKGIILFTFFYTSLNYFHYKQLREDYEETNKDDEKKK